MTTLPNVATIALATAVLAAGAAHAQSQSQVQATVPAQSQYCIKAEDLYQKIINGAMHDERKSTTTLITYSIYRNMAANRVVTLAWAGKCDMTPFLRMEISHQHEASELVTPIHEEKR